MNYIDVKNFRKYEQLFGDNGPAKIGHVNAVIKALNEKTGTGYKVYTALLNESGSTPPVATVLENTLGVTVTFQYNGQGDYLALFSDPIFDSPNEYVVITGNDVDTVITAIPVFFNALEIRSYVNGMAQDNAIGALGSHPPCVLEIRKYN